MRYFWNMVTGDVTPTTDKRIIRLLQDDGYVEVSRKQTQEIKQKVPKSRKHDKIP